MAKRAKASNPILRRARQWAFAPPYSGVPWLVFFYIIFARLCYLHGGVFAGHLIGFDDHTRMTQVLEWVNGHGWYDRTIRRVDPPDGFTTIWSRLVDVPIAFVIVVAQQFMSQRQAALVAAIVVPTIELIISFPVARYYARPLVGRNDAWLVVLFLMFTSVVNFLGTSISGFNWGEASHHPYYIILTLSLFGATGRVAAGVAQRHARLILGLSIGLLLAVGIEGFPMIAASATLLGFLAWAFGRPALAARGAEGMAYGAALALILLPMHQPPGHWLDISFAEPSILGPILVAAAALFLALEDQILRRFVASKFWSLAAIGFLAALMAAALIYAFPQILDGAAAGLSPAERAMALNSHFEAQPLYKSAFSNTYFISLVMPTIISLIAGVFAIFKATNSRQRCVAIAYFGFAGVSGALTECFTRYYHHALTTACAWLLWTWQRLKARLPKNRNYALAAFAIFIALGPFWLLFLPSMDADLPFLSYVVLYPAKGQVIRDPCDYLAFGNYLNAHYGRDTNIVVPAADSSAALYYSNLTIDFLSHYPSHDKFIDNDAFFATSDPNVARGIVMRHHIDLVALCAPTDAAPSMKFPIFSSQLGSGRVPPWLKFVRDGSIDGYLLYEVDKTELMKQPAK